MSRYYHTHGCLATTTPNDLVWFFLQFCMDTIWSAILLHDARPETLLKPSNRLLEWHTSPNSTNKEERTKALKKIEPKKQTLLFAWRRSVIIRRWKQQKRIEAWLVNEISLKERKIQDASNQEDWLYFRWTIYSKTWICIAFLFLFVLCLPLKHHKLWNWKPPMRSYYYYYKTQTLPWVNRGKKYEISACF